MEDIFGIVYLHLSTRNKERLALIEKGADASIFMKGKSNASPIWKILLLNLALLLMAIGIGVFIASILYYNMDVEGKGAPGPETANPNMTRQR